MRDSNTDTGERNARIDTMRRRQNPDEPIVNELVAVLRPHPGGLRKWSVMRAIRAHRNRMSQNIPQKFEEQVERVFRRFCADASEASSRVCAAESAPFYRPQDTAGEVWALFPDRAASLFNSGDTPTRRE